MILWGNSVGHVLPGQLVENPSVMVCALVSSYWLLVTGYWLQVRHPMHLHSARTAPVTLIVRVSPGSFQEGQFEM